VVTAGLALGAAAVAGTGVGAAAWGREAAALPVAPHVRALTGEGAVTLPRWDGRGPDVLDVARQVGNAGQLEMLSWARRASPGALRAGLTGGVLTRQLRLLVRPPVPDEAGRLVAGGLDWLHLDRVRVHGDRATATGQWSLWSRDARGTTLHASYDVTATLERTEGTWLVATLRETTPVD